MGIASPPPILRRGARMTDRKKSPDQLPQRALGCARPICAALAIAPPAPCRWVTAAGGMEGPVRDRPITQHLGRTAACHNANFQIAGFDDVKARGILMACRLSDGNGRRCRLWSNPLPEPTTMLLPGNPALAMDARRTAAGHPVGWRVLMGGLLQDHAGVCCSAATR